MTTTINKEPLRRINAMKNIITIALEQTDEEIFSPIRRARDRCGHTAKEKANFTLGPDRPVSSRAGIVIKTSSSAAA
jgi:hypothetical protein